MGKRLYKLEKMDKWEEMDKWKKIDKWEKLINGRNFWLNITGNMETVEEILIYFWTMSENRSEYLWPEKKSGFRASLRELKIFSVQNWIWYTVVNFGLIYFFS